MILAVLQARNSSSRLPGKVMAPVLGEPMIIRQLERLSRSRSIDELVVATSDHASDDGLAQLLASRLVTVRRGPLDDVFSRFAMVVDEFEPDTIVRLTADCPLADPDVIDRVIAVHEQSGSDYTSNSLVRTYPQGLDVECVSARAFAAVGRLGLAAAEREHVTLGIYSRPEEFRLTPVTQEPDLSDLRWTVDYPDDLEFVRGVYGRLYPSTPEFGQQEILALLREHPELNRTQEDVVR